MSKAPLPARLVAWIGRLAQKRIPYSASNPYLQGHFAPVDSEHTETRLHVTGRIPRELNGMLARIGPNPIRVDNPATYHWFLGDGMVHGMELRDGQAVWYRRRWVGSDSANRLLGRPEVPGRQRGVLDVVNTNVIGHGGRIWALVEGGERPAELDTDLETLGHTAFDGGGDRAYSAHPHRDPATGELHAICYDGLRPQRVQHMVVDRHCRVTRVLDIPVPHAPMIHDSALTRSYVLILDLPVTASLRGLLAGAALPYRWNPRHPARVGLLPRNGSASDIRWCSVEPCYVFHTCNAYETEDGSVILHAVVYDRMFTGSNDGLTAHKSAFERWTIDPVAGRVHRTPLCDRRQELPRYDERRTMAPNRYAYTIGTPDSPEERGPLPVIRHDLLTAQTTLHHCGPHHQPGEVVFVPRTDGAAEGEGWLLFYVYDTVNDRSQLVVLDAQNLDAEPQAVVHLPFRVPLGFHGNWIADAMHGWLNA